LTTSATPTTARRPRRPRATPATPYLVKVEPVPPAPLLRVFVAGNPVGANHMYLKRRKASEGYDDDGKRRRSDRALIPNATVWRDAIANSVMQWRYPESAPRPWLEVSCIFIGALADVDNLLKLALDGIKKGLLVDDCYVLRVIAERRKLIPGTERGAWIEVSELPPAQHTQPRASRTRNKTTDKRTA